MLKVLIFTMSYVSSIPCKPKTISHHDDLSNSKPNSQGEDLSKYWSGNNCAVGGTYSVNEYGANICEYPGDSCPTVKYFSYSGGGGSVELCCNSNSDCNYAAVKNYCHPDLKRCVDGSYFGCSEKEGPLFDSCK
jgi:hypothetical protein